MLLEASLILALIHVTIPLAYFAYMKRAAQRPWNISPRSDPLLPMSIIIPTYNEEDLIASKLDNILSQGYPLDLLEVIVVDSASSDGTVDAVLHWKEIHPEVDLKLILEEERRGKVSALKLGLENAKNDVIIIGDADAFWSEDSLKHVSMWMNHECIGAVSCIKVPKGGPHSETSYRHYYNILRIGESKVHSTPIFHGELAAFRREDLMNAGGFLETIGADDSNAATRIALSGKRAIIVEDVKCEELVPEGATYERWRIRRAQHLIQHFIWSVKRANPRHVFGRILLIESYLHLINPWMFVIALLLLIGAAAEGDALSIAVLIISPLSLLIGKWRMWLTLQIRLILATLKNLINKELVWEKQSKKV